MRNKKAQITLFIIVGILVVLGAVAYYYFLAPKQVETEVLDVTQIREYVTSCLDITVQEALTLIGKQGGYIEPVATAYPLFEGQEIYSVSYGIKKPFLIDDDVWCDILKNQNPTIDCNATTYPFSATNYPWENFPIGIDIPRPGLFGTINLPSLTQGQKSIKAQLEKYVASNITKCIDWSVFEDQGFEIETSMASADAVLGLDTVSVTLNYPLSIQIGEQKTQIPSFSSIVAVRFGRIYAFVKSLMVDEVSDITFDIESNYLQQPGINVTNIDQPDTFDDLIIVSDRLSSLQGIPYEFRFMRENRRPALDKDATCNDLKRSIDPDEDILVPKCDGDRLTKICDDDLTSCDTP